MSFFAVVFLVLTITQGVYILAIDWRSTHNQLLTLICTAIAIWLFAAAFGYSANNREDAMFWLTLTSPGYIFLHAIVLHFTLRYTGTARNSWPLLLYLPSIIFLYISFTDGIVFTGVSRAGKYWVLHTDYGNPTFHLLVVNYLSYYIIALILLYRHMQRSTSMRI